MAHCTFTVPGYIWLVYRRGKYVLSDLKRRLSSANTEVTTLPLVTARVTMKSRSLMSSQSSSLLNREGKIPRGRLSLDRLFRPVIQYSINRMTLSSAIESYRGRQSSSRNLHSCMIGKL